MTAGIDTNDQCAGCGAHVVWDYVDHEPDCPTPEVLGTPGHREKQVGAFRAFCECMVLIWGPHHRNRWGELRDDLINGNIGPD